MQYEETQGLGGLGSLKSTNDLSGMVADVTNGNPVGTTCKNGSSLMVIQDTNNDDSFVLAANATTPVLGVLDDNPKAGQAGKVKSVPGCIYKILAGAQITRGQKIISDAYGRAIPYASSGAGITYVVGIAQESISGAGICVSRTAASSACRRPMKRRP